MYKILLLASTLFFVPSAAVAQIRPGVGGTNQTNNTINRFNPDIEIDVDPDIRVNPRINVTNVVEPSEPTQLFVEEASDTTNVGGTTVNLNQSSSEDNPRTIVLPSAVGDNYSNSFVSGSVACPTASLQVNTGSIGFEGEDTFMSVGVSFPLDRPINCREQVKRQQALEDLRQQISLIPMCVSLAEQGVEVLIPEIKSVCDLVQLVD